MIRVMADDEKKRNEHAVRRAEENVDGQIEVRDRAGKRGKIERGVNGEEKQAAAERSGIIPCDAPRCALIW
jgi:hypothetical protein